jgi:hypothetical protein
MLAAEPVVMVVLLFLKVVFAEVLSPETTYRAGAGVAKRPIGVPDCLQSISLNDAGRADFPSTAITATT